MKSRLPQLAGFALLMVTSGLGWTQEKAQPPAPPRTAAVVTSELEALDTEYKALLTEETAIVEKLKAATGGTLTNRMATAGDDPELAAQLAKLKELENQVKELRAEVRRKVQESPAWKEQRERLARDRQRLIELQKAKMDRQARREALLNERRVLEAQQPTGEAK